MTQSRVREAVLGDAAAIAALQVRSWQRAYRGLVPDEFLDGLADDSWLERWRNSLGRPPRQGVHQIVATVDGTAVTIGGAGPALEPTHELTGQLYVLYTDPAHWGAGHGSAVLERIHRRLAADGHERAQLWVAAGNDRSIGFYEHHGWSRDGTTQREEVAGATFDEVRMVRDLP